ncbi:RNA-directed DNA polymerase, eukaryota [Tanacetum coccineum]|uniref:RNA-directed DNA polymerase, eukaryota n=1 Tax=Tanacetum coccineum TaxID=301880 RepID=A0ABQ5CGH4_9ASTR
MGAIPIRVKDDFVITLTVSDFGSIGFGRRIRKAVLGMWREQISRSDGFTLILRKFGQLLARFLFSAYCLNWEPISSGYKILATRLSFVISDLISNVQTAFLPNRQILDGPFIINEILARCKHKNQQAMFFKVDFAKAYDSIRWDYLDDVLKALGLVSRWRPWIKENHLAPFVFSLIMVSLHHSFNRAGLKRVFSQGMSINLKKSHILGLGIRGSIVSEAAVSLGCSVMKTPFNYLGIMVGGEYHLSTAYPSTWNSIIKEFNYLKVQGVDVFSHCKIRIGNGLHTRFWKDLWIGDCTLSGLFPRLFALDTEKDISVAGKLQSPLVSSFRRNVRGGIEEQQLEHLVALLDSVILSNSNDKWVSDLNGDGVFRVKDVRNLLDEFFLPRADIPTRWVKNIPIKVNIFAWKLALDRLPTRANLVQRNVVTESQSCPLCDAILEDTSHLFFNCSLARDVTRLLCRWWNLGVQSFSSYAEWLVWFNSVRLASNLKKDDKEFVEPWTIEEEVALCKAWVHASEDSVEGNAKKAAGIRPEVSQFYEIYNSVKDRHQSGACDTTIYQEAEIEYRTIYNSAFALTDCWKILKDHSKWRKVEMPKGFKSKKSRTSETTSQGNLDSAHIGLNLNDKATDSEDVEVQEVPPMGRDRVKKKASSSGARLEFSVAGDPSLVDALLSKFTMAATSFFRRGRNPPLSI